MSHVTILGTNKQFLFFTEKVSHSAEKPKSRPLILQNAFSQPKTFKNVQGVLFDQMKVFPKGRTVPKKRFFPISRTFLVVEPPPLTP